MAPDAAVAFADSSMEAVSFHAIALLAILVPNAAASGDRFLVRSCSEPRSIQHVNGNRRGFMKVVM